LRNPDVVELAPSMGGTPEKAAVQIVRRPGQAVDFKQLGLKLLAENARAPAASHARMGFASECTVDVDRAASRNLCTLSAR